MRKRDMTYSGQLAEQEKDRLTDALQSGGKMSIPELAKKAKWKGPGSLKKYISVNPQVFTMQGSLVCLKSPSFASKYQSNHSFSDTACNPDAKKRKRDDVQSTKSEELNEWLLSLDQGGGALLVYTDALVAEFDADLVQVRAAWTGCDAGASVLDSVDPHFFSAIGVHRTGHKLLFARGMATLAAKVKDSNVG